MATLVMVALDTYVWPSPPEPRLLESIAADLAITRKRLALVGQCYLDPFSAPLPSPLVKSRLAPGLALLNSVKERMKSPPQRLGALLQAIVTSEHVYLEVERLAAALLIRIAYRFQTIARAQLAGSETDLPDGMRQRFAALEEVYCSSLEYGLEKLRAVERSKQLTAQAPAPPPIEAKPGCAEGSASAVLQAGWEPYTRAELAIQLEAYRRMPILLSRLDSALSRMLPFTET